MPPQPESELDASLSQAFQGSAVVKGRQVSPAAVATTARVAEQERVAIEAAQKEIEMQHKSATGEGAPSRQLPLKRRLSSKRRLSAAARTLQGSQVLHPARGSGAASSGGDGDRGTDVESIPVDLVGGIK